MTRNAHCWVSAALLSAAVLTLTSCSSTDATDGQSSVAMAYEEGVPGGVAVETFQQTATVTSIDAANRKVTLVSPAGKKTTYKAGPEVINFDRIQVGDQLKVTIAEELVVHLADKAAPAASGGTDLVALAPKGAKPGALLVSTTQFVAKVKALDLKKRRATLEFPDGEVRTFPVRKDVDLNQRKVGDEVVIRITDALAISVEKP